MFESGDSNIDDVVKTFVLKTIDYISTDFRDNGLVNGIDIASLANIITGNGDC